MPGRVAILASGGGTTAEAFILAAIKGTIDVQTELVICNNPDAGIFERIHRLNKHYGLAIDTKLINARSHPAKTDETVEHGRQTEAEEQAILRILRAGKYDAVCLMGYMKKIGPGIVRAFGWLSDYTSPYQANLLNTHPGLLPATKGLYGIHVQEYVLAHTLPFGGQSLHLVSEKYDDGPVIAEHQVAVAPEDTPEMLFERIKTVEKKYLPTDIATFIENRQNYLQKGR